MVFAANESCDAKGVSVEGRGVTGNYDPRRRQPATPEEHTLVRPATRRENSNTPTAPDGIAEAGRLAQTADVVIVAVGESAEMSGEAASRTSLDLPGRQLEVIQAIHATGKPYVVVLMNGRPLTINWLAENSPAILETWFAGSQAGHAIAMCVRDWKPRRQTSRHFPAPRRPTAALLYYKRTGRPPTDRSTPPNISTCSGRRSIHSATA